MSMRAKVQGLFRATPPAAVMIVAIAVLIGAHAGRVWAELPVGDCFIAGTQVLLADGTSIPIEDIVAGQRVLTLNINTMRLEQSEVLRVIGQYHTGVGEDFTIRISFSDGMVNQNTNTEPYYVLGKGWASYLPDLTCQRYGLEVGLLQVGDRIYKHTDNGLQAVEVTRIEEVRQGVQTYNLAGISGNSNFFANGILVHNKGEPPPPPPPPPPEPPGNDEQQQLEEAQRAIAAAEAALDGALHDLQEAVETGASGQEIARAQQTAADAAQELKTAQEAEDRAVARAQEAAEHQTQAQGTEADIALADGTPTAGDPVRLATGNFVLDAEDLSYRIARMTIRVSRSYQSNRQGAHSFGPGWTFNYDTRIVRGVKPDAAAQAAALWSDTAQAEQSYQRLHAEYLRSMQVLSTAIPQTAEAAQTASAAVSAAQTALQKAQGVNSSSLINRASAALAGAQAAYAQAQALLASLSAARDQLQASGFQIEGIRLAGLELRALAEQADREAVLASANAGLNRYVVNDTDRASLQLTGNGALSLIDENGVALLFLLDEEPDYESGQRLPDGTLNYYPSGSSLTPALPAEDTLRLLQDGGFLRTRKDGTGYLYDYLGRLTAIADTNSNTISLAYSDAGHLERISDGFGRIMSLQRVGGRIVGIIDPIGRNFSYGYDAAGRLAEVTDGEGHTVRYRYSGPLLTTVIKPDDSFQEYSYIELDGRMVLDRTRDEEGHIEQFRYYPQQRYTEYINASGILERHYYDERYRITRVEYADSSAVERQYDAIDNLVRETDPLGRVIRYRYDERRNRIEAIDAEGAVERWSYTAFNKIDSYTDKLGCSTDYLYDSRGNLLEIRYPDNSRACYAYDSRGQVTAFTDPMGFRTEYGYDANGYVSLVRDAGGAEKHFENDALGNVIAYTDPAGAVIRYEYNGDNKVVRVQDALGGEKLYEYNNRKDLILVVDKNGNCTQFEYDKRHLLRKATNPLGETVEYHYRGDGKMVEKIIAGANHTRYDYDPLGRLFSKSQVETGAVVRYEYDAAGQLVALTDPKGFRSEYGYTDSGLLEWVRDPEGNTELRRYDAAGRITTVTDRLGRSVEYEYDALNRLLHETDPLGFTRLYGYDARGSLLELTDKNGQVTCYAYDPMRRLMRLIDAAGAEERFDYDPRGLLSERTDKNGHGITYQYDLLGRLVRKVDALGGVVQYAYDPAGNLTGRTDENGNTTRFEYDALNRLSRSVDPYGNATRYSYTYLGQPAEVIDALEGRRGYEYDELGRVLREIDPLGEVKSYQYDPSGNMLVARDELQRATSYEYDSLNRLVKKTDALGEAIRYLYDAVGNLIGEIDASGGLYSYEYDSLNRLVRERNRLGSEQSYTYQPNGELAGKTDFNGQATLYEYDAAGRLVRVRYAEGTEKSFTYDAAGNLTMAENPSGRLEYGYDELDRLVRAEDSGSGQRIGYTYDAAGNRLELSWMEDQRRITYGYGKRNELLEVRDPEGGVTRFGYDVLGREVSRRLANGVITETSYDAAGRVTALKNRGERGAGDEQLRSLAYLYNAAGQRSYQVDERGRITAYEYDEVGRLKAVCYPFESGKMLEDFQERLTLGLGPAFREGKKAEVKFALPALPGDEAARLREDLQEELLASSRKPGKAIKGRWEVGIGEGATEFAGRLEVPWEVRQELESAYGLISESRRGLELRQRVWTEQFGYDERSNRAFKANGWGRIDYAYNPANEILAAGKRSYAHDRNGNLIREALGEVQAQYLYTPDNRIERISGEAEVEYAYDALGRRSTRQEYGSLGHNRPDQDGLKGYLYDGLGFEVLAEFGLDEGKAPQGKAWGWWENKPRPDAISEYLYAQGRIVSRSDFREPGHLSRGGGSMKDRLYYHQDILGSTLMLTGGKGKVEQAYGYDAFGSLYEGGRRRGEDQHRVTEYLYNGKRYDAAVGLYDYGFRDYSPQLARWTSPDPIRAGANWYAYVNNDPVNLVDHMGLSPEILGDGAAVEPIARAEELVGTVYGHAFPGQYGGSITVAEQPEVIDCTELVSYVYNAPLYRTWEFGSNPNFSIVTTPQRGDVIIDIATDPFGQQEGHAAIYVGEGGRRELLQADAAGGVRYTSDYLSSYYERHNYTNHQRRIYRPR